MGRTYVKSIKGGKQDLDVCRWCGEQLTQVTKVLKVDVSSDKHPWSRPQGSVRTQDEFKLQQDNIWKQRKLK